MTYVFQVVIAKSYFSRLSQEYEPYTLVKREKLVGLFTFDDLNITNVVHELDNNFYDKSMTHAHRGYYNGNIQLSSVAIHGSSIYFDGRSNIVLPLSFDPIIFPKITIGAWVKVTTIEDSNKIISGEQYVIAHSKSTDERCKRGIIIASSWQACNIISFDYDIEIDQNQWTFVAVAYDSVRATVNLYINDKIVEYNTVNSGQSLGNIVIGGSILDSRNNFHGYIDNVFVYSDFLFSDEIDFLRLGGKYSDYYPIAGNFGSAVDLQNGFGIKISSHTSLGTFNSFTICSWFSMQEFDASNSETILVYKAI